MTITLDTRGVKAVENVTSHDSPSVLASLKLIHLHSEGIIQEHGSLQAETPAPKAKTPAPVQQPLVVQDHRGPLPKLSSRPTNISQDARKLQQVNPLATAGFPGFESLKPISEAALKIAIVANGKSVLNEKGKGALIDAHDLVCRFNYFKTAGFEDYVGKRVDLWFLGELKEPGPRGTRGVLGPRGGTMDLSQKPQKYIIPIVYPTSPACAKKARLAMCQPDKGSRKYRKATEALLRKAYARYKIADKLEFMPTQIEQLLQLKYRYGERWPSSGILALVYLLEMYPNSIISTHGYDFASASLGHYWEKIKKKSTVHSMKREGGFLGQLMATGRVVKL